jgi:hypothetical protein
MHVIRHRDMGDHRVDGATVHEVRYLPRSEIRTLEGIPLVSPSLALLQLSGLRSVGTSRLARAIDAAWSDRLVTYTTLSTIDRCMSRQGRRGLVRFRELVQERGPNYVPPASNLEGRFAEILARGGLPAMRRQVDCSGEEGWIGRVDFRDLEIPLVVEVQSERFHRGLTAERSDLERIGRLRSSGMEVLEISDEDLFHHSPDVLARVTDARARALALHAA